MEKTLNLISHQPCRGDKEVRGKCEIAVWVVSNPRKRQNGEKGIVGAARGILQETIDVVPIEVHVMRLGPVALATNPYELFLDYGNRIRARSKASQTFLVQQCCGSFGYVPTEKAERGSHYSAYVSSGTVGHEGGDLLVRKTVSEINDMLKKD